MTHHLKNFLRGLGDALTIQPHSRGYSADGGGFAADRQRLRQDFAAVGSGMRKGLEHAQPPHERPRKG